VAAQSDAIIWLAGLDPKRHRICPGFLPLLRQLYPKSLGKDFSFDSIADEEPSSGSVILSAPPKRPLIHRLDLHFSDTSAFRNCGCLGTAGATLLLCGPLQSC
jgi:hypothetical protein